MQDAKYVAGWNQPGCLPDTADPLPEFDSFDEAADYILEEASRHAEDADLPALDADLARRDLAETGHFWLGGEIYWVTVAEDGFDGQVGRAILDAHDEGEDFEEIADAQGWTDWTQLLICRDFISSEHLDDRLAAFAAHIAEQENR